MKKLDMGYKNLAPMTFSFEESQEIARDVWDAYGATAFSASSLFECKTHVSSWLHIVRKSK